MILPVEGWWDSADEELPGYFDEPVTGTPHDWMFAWAGDDEPRSPVRAPASITVPLFPLDPPSSRRAPMLPVTFLRAVNLPFVSSAGALQHWWDREEHLDRVELGHCRLVGPPSYDRSTGIWRIDVRLGRGVSRPALAMDLELFPWLGPFGTKVCLRPRHLVRPRRSYFRTGHGLLDRLIEVMGR